MNTIIGELGKSQKFIDLSKQIEKEKSPISISGLTSVGMTEIISGINGYNKKSILLITYNEIQAKKILQNLQTFDKEKVVFFPKKEVVTYDYVAESKDLPYERIETLNKIKEKKNIIVVTTIEALMQKLPSKKSLFKNVLEFKVGDIYNLEDIKKSLVNMGYSRCDLIEGRGQFSVRGGIVDISADDKTGIRIELWGDEVDSIRNFSISSQRSISTLEKAKIYPANEYVLDDKIENICKKIRQKLTEGKQDEIIEEDIEQIKAGNYISKIDKYFNQFYTQKQKLLDYLQDDYILCFDEMSKINQRRENIIIENNNLIKSLIEKERVVPEAIRNISEGEFRLDKWINELEQKSNKSMIFMQTNGSYTNINQYEFNYREINVYKSEIEIFIADIKKWIKEKKQIRQVTGI